MKVAAKLFKIQEEVITVSKTSENPHFKSKYFDINKLIETINPLLTKNGLLLTQPMSINDAGAQLVSTVITDIESGETMESTAFVPLDNNPQKMGSAISYQRRYTLQSLLGLQAVDDDGEAATGRKTPAKKAAAKKTTTTGAAKPVKKLF